MSVGAYNHHNNNYATFPAVATRLNQSIKPDLAARVWTL
ncbi:MAG: hypothetical protein ACLUOI_25605 [Eisenbergiella sp.]